MKGRRVENKAPQEVPQVRSIWERMTNPTAAESQAGDGLRKLGRSHVEMVVGSFFDYLASHRDDMEVKRFRNKDGHGWVLTVREPVEDRIMTNGG